MNKLFLILIISIFSLSLNAQGIDGGPVNIPTDGVVDGIYIQEHVPTKRLVPYEFVREADVMYQKRVWRYIDLREKINHPLYFPMDDIPNEAAGWVRNTNRWSLWTVIRHHVLKGDLIMYEPENPNAIGSFDGDLFKYPVYPAPGKNYDTDSSFRDKVQFLMATKTDRKNPDGSPMIKTDDITGEPILEPDPVTGVPSTVLMPPLLNWYLSKDIVEYRLKEDWFFDKERSQMDVRILGLCPVVYDGERNDKGELTLIKGKKELFWLYFPHCRFYFVNYNVYNPKNDANWMSFDDLFQKRMFNSTVYKQSNIYDRSLDTYKSGIEALFESQRITEELRNFEHDLWHF
jgi:gliding motility associated protien GldN